MNKLIGVLAIVCCFIFQKNILAQEIPKILIAHPMYSGTEEIINGTKWIYEKKYRGVPFLNGRSWTNGDVRFNGKLFENVQLNYDLYKDEFILFVPEEGNKKFVVLSNKYLEGFSFTDSTTRQKRHFKYFQLPDTKEKQLYEIAYAGNNSSFLIKHKVTVNSNVGGGFLGDYNRSVELFVKSEDQYKTFRNKKNLLAILGKHITEMKRFIRKNGFRINKNHYMNIAPVIEHFDQLEKL